MEHPVNQPLATCASLEDAITLGAIGSLVPMQWKTDAVSAMVMALLAPPSRKNTKKSLAWGTWKP